MKLPRCLLTLAVVALLGIRLHAGDTTAAAPRPESQSILPTQFAGWQMQGVAQFSQNPAAADPANAAVLQEYGFNGLEKATYTRDDGRTLKIRAARFADASGAFGAYTFYLDPQMAREEIGDQGASLGPRILFYRGQIVVDAVFSQLTVMSAAELRELAGTLSLPGGNAGALPPVLAFMPRHAYVANTEKYAEGPLALGAISSPLAGGLVDFSADPQVVLGQYTTPSGPATLMLIYYPTPQLAAEHLRRIDAANHAAQPKPGVESVEKAGPFFDKRTGPIVAIAAGAISEGDARTLLGSVNYDARVTRNENTYFDKKNNIANFLVNLILLCMILGGLAVGAGLAFGGVRILVKRLFPGRVFDRPEQMEFISLHLSETIVTETMVEEVSAGPETPPGEANRR
ncbi:MAG TPA: DUF6599 family protein [Candidatus Aquilonibacter sp.]|nr:DUF6599 family protein [Candidatus Aquilonibacter sp.]